MQFSPVISTLSLGNSVLAEFIPLASIINFPSFVSNAQDSDTTLQSSIDEIKSSEFTSTLFENPKLGISLSSVSISINAKVKFLFILSSISIFSKFFSLSKINEDLAPHLFSIFLKSSRFTPRTSSSDSNSENADFGSLYPTIATFAGSIAEIESPNSFTLILTSKTMSEIKSIALDKSAGFSSLTLM